MTRKTSIREIPVTISAFSMGMLAMPMKKGTPAFFHIVHGHAGAEADEVATRAERKAMTIVFPKGQKDLFILKSSVYQRVVKPPQRASSWTG